MVAAILPPAPPAVPDATHTPGGARQKRQVLTVHRTVGCSIDHSFTARGIYNMDGMRRRAIAAHLAILHEPNCSSSSSKDASVVDLPQGSTRTVKPPRRAVVRAEAARRARSPASLARHRDEGGHALSRRGPARNRRPGEQGKGSRGAPHQGAAALASRPCSRCHSPARSRSRGARGRGAVRAAACEANRTDGAA